ncbi:hypothetical protein D3C73_1311000 [compost metagenome]
MPGPADGSQHAGMAGVGADITENRRAQVRLGEARQYIVKHPQADDTGVGDDQNAAHAALLAQLGQAASGARFTEQLGGGGKTEWLHVHVPFVLVGERHSDQKAKCASSRLIRHWAPPRNASQWALARGRMRRQ